MAVQQSDALGGAGSISDLLISTALNGIARTADGYNSTKYPLTSFNEPYAVEGGGAYEAGQGYLVPRAAPQRGYGATQQALPFLQNPIVWGIGGAILVLGVIAVAVSRK